MTLSQAAHTNAQVPPELLAFGHHKQIPENLAKNILTALSFYPELRDTRIHFILKENIRGSVMQAQPVFHTLLRKRAHRRYRIHISEEFKLVNARQSITEIPDTVMIGWIGHELGHILDYEGRTNKGLMHFGYRYVLDPSFVKQAERVADTLAVARGMGRHIIATKRFILDHASLPQAYKDKIARLYLSPDVILEQVQQLEAKALKDDLPQRHQDGKEH
ncbi:hypothetical protein BUE76_01245 [Cnuella takakiae]|nr:hypothetical protein BUE76_01245 [Cnuella takakiae]